MLVVLTFIWYAPCHVPVIVNSPRSFVVNSPFATNPLMLPSPRHRSKLPWERNLSPWMWLKGEEGSKRSALGDSPFIVLGVSSDTKVLNSKLPLDGLAGGSLASLWSSAQQFSDSGNWTSLSFASTRLTTLFSQTILTSVNKLCSFMNIQKKTKIQFYPSKVYSRQVKVMNFIQATLL